MDFTDKHILITGASRGIGAAVAKAAGAAGAHCIIAARTVGGLEEVDDAIRAAGGPGATIIPVDLLDGPKIDQMAAHIAERFMRIDAVFGCAGRLGKLMPVQYIAPKMLEETMRLNFFANWWLLRAMHPLLKASEAGRVLMMTSGVVKHPQPFFTTTACSKAALESLVQTYAEENKNTPIRANACDPGIVGTRLVGAIYPGKDISTLAQPDDVAPKILPLLSAEETRNGEIISL